MMSISNKFIERKIKKINALTRNIAMKAYNESMKYDKALENEPQLTITLIDDGKYLHI